jgi:Tfp pilus assembly protein PilO
LRVLDNLGQNVEQLNEEMQQLQESFKKRRQNPVVKTVIDLVSSVNEIASAPPISSKVINLFISQLQLVRQRDKCI